MCPRDGCNNDQLSFIHYAYFANKHNITIGNNLAVNLKSSMINDGYFFVLVRIFAIYLAAKFIIFFFLLKKVYEIHFVRLLP